MSGAPVSTDTRRLRPGEVFLALPGERYAGADFIGEALARGASAIVARAEDLAGLEAPAGVALVAVEDPRAELLRRARERRERLRVPVVGVTGSVGKTTTSGLLAAALGAHVTPDGRNTGIGVAATLAGAPRDAPAVVVELAMRERGDVAGQAALARPTAGVITAIGAAHVGRAGSLAAIAAGKAELLAALPPGAPAALPAGEPLLDPYRRADLRTVTHGPGGDVEALGHDGRRARLRVGGEVVEVATRQPQPHNLRNLAAAVAMLRALGRETPAALDAPLPPLRWQPGRLGAVELVLDCMNSSPPALAAALTSFAAEPARGRRLAVLGIMADLGRKHERLHRAAGAHARRAGIDELVAVGEGAEGYLAGFGGGRAVAGPGEARALLLATGRPGDRALVKASRAPALERILEPA